MGLTLTQTGDWTGIEGVRNTRRFTIAFDTSYLTGGESLTAADMALTTIDTGGVRIDPKGGYTFEYDYTNETVIAYRSAGFTPAGTNTAPTLTLTGGQLGTEETVNISSDVDAATLGKTSTTTRTGITGVQAPAFTGTVVSAAVLVEVTSGVNLGSLTGVVVHAVGW